MAKVNRSAAEAASNAITVQEKLSRQFRGLDPNDPSQWPIVPRFLLFFAVAAIAVVAGWYFLITPEDERLEQIRGEEVALRDTYKRKVTQAVNLDALKKQLEQVQQYVTQLEKQLPSKAEMDALLSDINQAGIGRSLQFELFKPGSVVVRDYYAELPITVKLTGSYHDMGLFAADIAHLPRIVTLNNIRIVPENDRNPMSGLRLEGTAKTFRYLDPDEVESAKKNSQGK